jgi:hypothetical protein
MPLEPVTVRIGPFLPDLAPLASGGARLVQNVLPQKNSYIPVRRLSPVTDGLSTGCLGSAFFRAIDNSVQGFAGDTANLYLLTSGGTAWDDISGATYATASGQRWRWTQYGDLVVTTNFTNEVQKFELTQDSAFSNLGTGLPRAKFCAAVGNFLMLANIVDPTDGNCPTRVHWSADGAPDSFPAPNTDAARQVRSGRQDLIGEYGEITGLYTGLMSGSAAIMRENAIAVANELFDAQYVFSFDTLAGGRGTPCPDGGVVVGGVLYFPGQDGFYKFDGAQIEPIGNSAVNRFFFGDCDPSSFDQVLGAADAFRTLIYWAYIPREGTGARNAILVYNWETNEWTIIRSITIQAWSRVMSTGITMEGLDNLAASMDGIQGSLDDRIYAGGGIPEFGAFDGDRRLGTFSGETLFAFMGTEETQPIPGARAFISHIRPLIDTPCTARMYGRDNLNDTPVRMASAVTNKEGKVPVLKTARYVSYEIFTKNGDAWTDAQGIEVELDVAGDRALAEPSVAKVPPIFATDDRGVILTTDDGILTEVVA